MLGAYAASAGPGIGPDGGPAQAGLYQKLYGPGGLAAAAAGMLELFGSERILKKAYSIFFVARDLFLF